MPQYPTYSLSGGNQYPAIATATPAQYPVIAIVDAQGALVTNVGNGPADGTWTTITAFTNSWVAGSPVPQYMKDSRGIVHCRGIIQSGTASTIAFTFPVGFRPYAASGTPAIYFHYNVAPHSCLVGAAGGMQPFTVGPVDLSIIHFPTVLL